jgi:hypothetical protein
MVQLAPAPNAAVVEPPAAAWLGDSAAADASIAHYLAASEGMRVMMDVCWKICAALLPWSRLREQSKCCPWRSCCSSVPKTT